MADNREAVYCTLLMSDNYLPGAMVLAHSLRDNGTKAKIVVLVTLETLEVSTIQELKSVYDEVIPVTRVVNVSPANLYLMDRPDLISTFTKIELWKQVQYRQIVYIDADIVALRAPDELLTLNTHFAAAPDIGWPDCFNSGVMVFRPNLQDYYSLLAFAQRGISFDGADQGLLNMHFKNWQRLSFAYNCTPSGHYQYIPAFRHFQSTISLVHYIGQQKPWTMPRQTYPVEGPYSQLLARWWAVYDRHYRPVSSVVKPTALQPSSKHTTNQRSIRKNSNISGQLTFVPAVTISKPPAPESQAAAEKLQPECRSTIPAFTIQKPLTFQPGEHAYVASPALPNESSESASETTSILNEDLQSPVTQDHLYAPELPLSVVPQYVHGERHTVVHRPILTINLPVKTGDFASKKPACSLIPDALSSKEHLLSDVEPPPALEANCPIESTDAKKEDLENTITQTSRIFHPPIHVWDASRAPPPADSKPEAANFPTQTYTMSKSTKLFQPPETYPEAPTDMYYKVPPKVAPSSTLPHLFPWESQIRAPSRVFLHDTGDVPTETKPDSTTPIDIDITSSIHTEPTPTQALSSTWDSYARTNAWDEVPGIEQYMRSLQKPRRKNVQLLAGSDRSWSPGSSVSRGRRPSLRLTDFPTEVERPSLPVTPAPIRRGSYFEKDSDQKGSIQDTESVTKQEEWNPLDQLERLHRHHCEFLDRALRDISKEEGE
ncbi:glycogenin glucosyltransferase [Ophidiomyces ophidiicola]|nr:glycogenin glucosyltransferase [Ophidiomyces ophidiicola]